MNLIHCIIRDLTANVASLSLCLLRTDSFTKPNTFPDSALFEATDPPYAILLLSDNLCFNSLCMSSKFQLKVFSFLFPQMSRDLYHR